MDDHRLHGDSVESLYPGLRGRWLVSSRGTREVWDVDAMTYARHVDEGSGGGTPEPHDGTAHPITQVAVWPAVGERSVVLFADPDAPATQLHRVSARIHGIERLL